MAEIELGIEIYENFMKISLPYIENNYAEEEFFEGEGWDNSNGFFIDNTSFKSISIKKGKYRLHRDPKGNRFLLVEYVINK